MIITSTVGKIDAAIGRNEGPIMAYMSKSESDFAKNSLLNTLYNVKSSNHYSESVAGMNGIGDFVATDGAVPYDDMEEMWPKQFMHTVFKKGIEIKRETIDDSRIIDMQNQAGTLTDASNRTREKFVHAPFNFCTVPTFSMAGGTFDCLGNDKMPLASVAHPSKTGKAAVQGNYLTNNPLTQAGLKAAEDLMESLTDDIGEKANIFPDTILTGWANRNVAWELTQSEKKPTDNTNAANPYQDKYQVIISRWITDPNMYFLIDSAYMKRNLFWIDRKKLEIASHKDDNTKNWLIDASNRSRYTC